jgi:hypothetical protein
MAVAFTTTQDNGQNTTVWQERDFVAAEAQYNREVTALNVKFFANEVTTEQFIATLEAGRKVVYQARGFGIIRMITWECIAADGSFRRIEVVCKPN